MKHKTFYSVAESWSDDGFWRSFRLVIGWRETRSWQSGKKLTGPGFVPLVSQLFGSHAGRTELKKRDRREREAGWGKKENRSHSSCARSAGDESALDYREPLSAVSIHCWDVSAGILVSSLASFFNKTNLKSPPFVSFHILWKNVC